jgi:hypothetical protein
MYPSILSFETINKLELFFECGNPRPQDAGTPLLAQMQKKISHFIILIAVLENVPPDAGLQKRATFSPLNVGLARTGNQTHATCEASSVARRSAIHYASSPLCPKKARERKLRPIYTAEAFSRELRLPARQDTLH